MNLLRLLKVLLRGLRPISHSLSSISSSLDTLTRIAVLRLRLEHNEILPNLTVQSRPSKADMTELAYGSKTMTEEEEKKMKEEEEAERESEGWGRGIFG